MFFQANEHVVKTWFNVVTVANSNLKVEIETGT